MAGIVFVGTSNLEDISNFYETKIQMKPWLDQPGIRILRHENLLVGFQQKEIPDLNVLLTFFFNNKSEVDNMYESLKSISITKPKENPKYQIYNFFATDLEGRKFEIQTFLHDLPPY